MTLRQRRLKWHQGWKGLKAFACLLSIFIAALISTCAASETASSESIPPAPHQFFTDKAGVVSPEVARELNRKLEGFEQATSNQILVAVYPFMPSRSSIEDYTFRVAEAWKAGQKGRDNGAILFIFMKERQIMIQVGYGLEGALTDFRCRQIIETEIKPPFMAGEYATGLRNGVNAMIQTTEGEYTGSGAPPAKQGGSRKGGSGLAEFLLLLLILYLIYLFRSRGGRSGPGGRGDPPIFWGGGGFGGPPSSGGGGFSGGGGRFGGGGASGRW